MAQMYRILGKRGRITIPFEIRQRVGFSQNDVLSFTESPDGRTVLVKREKLCDDNCKPERAQQRKEETDSVSQRRSGPCVCRPERCSRRKRSSFRHSS